jgi:sulfide:quinone oxidoreductase
LHDVAHDAVTVELVAPDAEFVYRPLAVAQPFRLGEARRFPLSNLVAKTGASLTRASANGVDTDRKIVETSSGELPYDQLLVTLGAKPVEAVAGALTFRGPQDEVAFGELLSAARGGRARRIAFTMPAGISWPLPLYELALLTAVHLSDTGAGNVTIELVTPEPRPLQIFGTAASEAIAELFELHGIRLTTGAVPLEAKAGALHLAGGGEVEADRVVSLPRLEGPRFPGLPEDGTGFITVDDHQRVRGHDDVFAAGDAADFPIKQGGLAAQQADAAAEAIAAAAGADVEPQPFTPVLRGLLLTGLTPRFLRTELASGAAELDTEALWWPPAKIVGRYLAPFLAAQMQLPATPPRSEGIEVEVELDRDAAGAWQRI